MGALVEGRWHNEDAGLSRQIFERPKGAYAADLSEACIRALSGDPQRFCLIASASCPWSHRATILRQLKSLEIPLQIAHGPRREGYAINGGSPWVLPGTGAEVRHLHQVYTAGDPSYSGRVTVPVLWDSQDQRVVSNESSKILRAFDAVQASRTPSFTFVPKVLRPEIDALNAFVQDGLSEAVYRAGFARTQPVYDRAVAQVFRTLDRLEARLAEDRYLLGCVVTEADWRLFTTLVRFDAVYHSHFRCTRRRLIDYPALWSYARDLYAWRGVAGTVDFEAILDGYYRNDGDHNPHGIIAAAPEADWSAPHDRDALGLAVVALRGGGAAKIQPATLQLFAG